jgi:hypothetical protein
MRSVPRRFSSLCGILYRLQAASKMLSTTPSAHSTVTKGVTLSHAPTET